MQTQRSPTELAFGRSGRRTLVGAFDGGAIASNGGVVLLADRDRRDGTRIAHTIADLLHQRLFGLALGHEDLIDRWLQSRVAAGQMIQTAHASTSDLRGLCEAT